MTIRDQIANIIFNMNPINTANDAADAICAAFPSLRIGSENHKIIAEALRDGARGDIWYHASEYGDTTGAARIETVQAAMEDAADILHKEEPDGDETEKPYKWVCGECGEQAVYWETTCYWDARTQSIEASDTFDERDQHCGHCGAENEGKKVQELRDEDDDPVHAYLKRMAERGDDEAKSLLA
jgi:hypothetical protein